MFRLNRSMLSEILIGHGYEIVHAAENGREGVEAYRKVKPDIVIMDISMPEMDGISALKLILEQDPGAKVVMCSTFGQQSFILHAIGLGVKDFIVDHVRNRG